MAFRFGFAREVITPELGVPLCGYFVPRPNDGKYDDLYVRACVMESAGQRYGIVSCDLCFLSLELIERFKKEIAGLGLNFSDRILFCATHSHTAPYPDRFFGYDPDQRYLMELVMKVALAVKHAAMDLAPAELFSGLTRCETLAFNRRYWMNDGKVVTNPGPFNSAVERPEGPVDYDIPVLAVRQNDKISAVIVNIVNHTDTIDGNTVSADWPGRMERAIQEHIGYDVPVITLIGCSGNVNHFDLAFAGVQSAYAVAQRIGIGYAIAVCDALEHLTRLDCDAVKFDAEDIRIDYCTITDEDAAKAQAVLDKPFDGKSCEMTAVGLANGEGAVARFFAQQLLDYRKTCSGKSRVFRLVSLKFGTEFAIVSLPGEPFTEIGMAIKKAARFPQMMVAALAMGECGYIPLPECFERGGYEILPVEGGGPAHDTAPKLIDAASQLVNR